MFFCHERITKRVAAAKFPQILMERNSSALPFQTSFAANPVDMDYPF